MQVTPEIATIDALFNEVQNEGNLDALAEIVHEDVQVSSISFDGVYDGLEDYRAHFEMMDAAFDDIEVEYEVLAEGEDAVVVETRFNGIHVGPFMEIEATGNPVSYPGIAVIELEDGRITSVRSAFDLF
ncbi:MAG: ester cyclase, partial [Halobacteriales archaeon]|nr:ester cyclase [Halobacteriales archaeon]